MGINSQFPLIKSHRFQIKFQLFPTNFQSFLTSFQFRPIKWNKCPTKSDKFPINLPKFPAKSSRSLINSLRNPRSPKNLDSWQMISPPSNHVASKKKLRKPRSQSMKKKKKKVPDTENKFSCSTDSRKNSSEKY